MSETLVVPRRLAIQILAHAQTADAGVNGYVAETGAALRFSAGAPPAGLSPWAAVRSQPDAGQPTAVPDGAARLLTVGLDTKGVLQLRCWLAQAGGVREAGLRVTD